MGQVIVVIIVLVLAFFLFKGCFPTAPSSSQVPSSRPNTPSMQLTPSESTKGSVNNPYPFGSVISIEYGDAIFEMKIEDVIRGTTADSLVKNASIFNSDPPTGMEYILIKVDIHYVSGSSTVRVSNTDISLVSNGKLFNWSKIGFITGLDELGYPKLGDVSLVLPGSTASGWNYLIVDKDDQHPILAFGLNLVYPDLKEGIFFALSK